MHAIKMDPDKNLSTTIRATIFQYETNADTLVILVPKIYEETNIADCTVLLRYITPNGIGHSEELELDPEPHNKQYFRYHLKVTSDLTKMVGVTELWLSIIDMHDNVVLRSNSVEIEVTPAKQITDYLCGKDLNQLDRMAAKVAAIEKKQADGLMYDTDTRRLQLKAGQTPIGNEVTVPSSSYTEEIVQRVADEWLDMTEDDDTDDEFETDETDEDDDSEIETLA